MKADLSPRPQAPWSSGHGAKSYVFLVAVAAAILAIAGCGAVPDQEAVGRAPTDQTASAPCSWPNAAAMPMAAVGSQTDWSRAQNATYNLVEALEEHEAELAWRLQYCRYIRGEGARKRLALTFDDGPHPGYTPKLLAILRKLNVKATFFLVGRQAQQFPDLVKALVADGHNLGNHTYRHSKLTRISKKDQEKEITTCGEVIRDITGKAPHLFRPPGGHYNVQVGRLASALGYRVILWTDNSGDYNSPGRALIERRVLRRTEDGDIILFHDGINQTLDALPGLVGSLRARGYRFVTIDEMIGGS